MENLHFSQMVTAQAKKYGDKTVLYSRKKTTESEKKQLKVGKNSAGMSSKNRFL